MRMDFQRWRVNTRTDKGSRVIYEGTFLFSDDEKPTAAQRDVARVGAGNGALAIGTARERAISGEVDKSIPL